MVSPRGPPPGPNRNGLRIPRITDCGSGLWSFSSTVGFAIGHLFCNSVCLCAVAFLCPKFGAGFPALPCPRQQFVAMATLGEFLQTNGLTDPKIINYMTQTLQLAIVSDFASYWTSAEYEKGVQTDIVQQIADVSLPSSKLQIARLRAAWKLAQGQAAAPIATKGAPAKKAAGAGVVGMGWSSPEVTTSTWDGLWEALIYKARNPQKFKMDVSNVSVADRPGFLARSMTINPTGANVTEHI